MTPKELRIIARNAREQNVVIKRDEVAAHKQRMKKEMVEKAALISASLEAIMFQEARQGSHEASVVSLSGVNGDREIVLLKMEMEQRWPKFLWDVRREKYSSSTYVLFVCWGEAEEPTERQLPWCKSGCIPVTEKGEKIFTKGIDYNGPDDTHWSKIEVHGMSPAEVEDLAQSIVEALNGVVIRKRAEEELRERI